MGGHGLGIEPLAEMFLPERPYALTPAPRAPTGTLEAVGGGFVITSRWEWATGLPNADFMVHAVQLATERANWFLSCRSAEVIVDDVWFASGMRPTSSNTVRLHEQSSPLTGRCRRRRCGAGRWRTSAGASRAACWRTRPASASRTNR
jgi:alkylation response protein AidB-like acyl-CoA dehydrogenase